MAPASRRVFVLTAILLFSAAACSAGEKARPPVGPAPAKPAPPAPTIQPLAPPTTLAALPTPVDMPEDSYAPEPVVEIGTIEIPALALVHPVFQGVTLRNIDRGPSHWPGTALPGERGNTVFAAHRVTNSQPFRDIDRLANGDEVVFTVNGSRSTYRVTGNQIVEPDDTWIAIQRDGFTGTLYTCHPPGSLTYRYVVMLELVGVNPA